MCTSYQEDSAMSCLIDGSPKQVELTDYFSLMGQTKIDGYYLMDYFCSNKIHLRGNYKNKSNISKNLEKKLLSLLLLINLLI